MAQLRSSRDPGHGDSTGARHEQLSSRTKMMRNRCCRNGYSIGLMVELSQSSQNTTSRVKFGMQNLQIGWTNAQISYGAHVNRKTTIRIAKERALFLSFFLLRVPLWCLPGSLPFGVDDVDYEAAPSLCGDLGPWKLIFLSFIRLLVRVHPVPQRTLVRSSHSSPTQGTLLVSGQQLFRFRRGLTVVGAAGSR